MASIKKIEGKTGTSYKITVTKGRDSSGKQIRHFKTWTPDRPMTARQMEKEVQRVAVEFEREIELGFQADNRQTFEQYANYVLDLKKRQGVSNNTIVSYEKALKRAFPSIGYMKLGSIRPQHLNKLYRSLEEPGARNTRDKAVAKVDLVGLIESKYPSRKAFSRECCISHTVVNNAANGKVIDAKMAEIIANNIGAPVKTLFEIRKDNGVLSSAIVKKVHSVISIVLAQAEKEMLIPYNPAAKATPPVDEEHVPDYFQPETLARILEALETEPIKWRAPVHFMIVTGCRRGEVLGVKWRNIDLESRQVKIESCLSYIPKIGIYDGPTKTKTTRFVAIPEETALLLKNIGHGKRSSG